MSEYSSAEWLTIIAALGVLISSIGGVIINVFVSIRNGQKIAGVSNQVAVTQHKTEGLVNQVQEVHTLTNNNLSAVKAELATATAQITALREVVTDLKTERGKTAAAAGKQSGVAAIPAVVLDSIDKNTADTAKNTERTEKKVDDLKP